MGRPSASIHIVTFLLTILLAWPWNVVLSAAESFLIATQVRLGTIHAQGTPRVQRVARFGGWDQPGCSVIAQDYDRDEEGDDGSPPSPSTDLSSIQTLPFENASTSSLTSLVLPVGTSPMEQLRRLRC